MGKILGKEWETEGFMDLHAELQPGTCPGQLGDGEEVDAEEVVHKVHSIT